MESVNGSGHLEPADIVASPFLISDEAMEWVQVILASILMPVMCLFSTVVNVVNVFVFSRQKLKDATVVSLFFLSVSDLLNSFIALVASSVVVLNFVSAGEKVNISGLQSMFFWARIMFADMSVYVTVLISVDRCLCIMRPLKFKTTVTFQRRWVQLVVIILFTWACYCPLFVTHGMFWKVTDDNRTVLQVWYSPSRPAVEFFSHIFTSIVMNTGCQATVFVCAVFMYRGLRKSTKFKQRRGQDEANEGLGQKEKSVVKMVFLVAMVLNVSAIPQLVNAYTLRILPTGHYFLNTYANFILTLTYCTLLSNVTNCAVNIFIYYRFNSRFREVCQTLVFRRAGSLKVTER